MGTFQIMVEDVIDGVGRMYLQCGGKIIGNPGAVCEIAIPAQHWAGVLEPQLSGWPPELAHVVDPVESFRLIHEAYAGEESGLPFHLHLALRPFVLTNNMGPFFDGFFSIVRPGPTGTVLLVHDQDGPVEVETIDADDFRREVLNFVARFSKGWPG